MEEGDNFREKSIGILKVKLCEISVSLGTYTETK